MSEETNDERKVLMYAMRGGGKAHSGAGLFSLAVMMGMVAAVGMVVLLPQYGQLLLLLPLFYVFGFMAAVAGVMQNQDKRVLAVVSLVLYVLLFGVVLSLLAFAGRLS